MLVYVSVRTTRSSYRRCQHAFVLGTFIRYIIRLNSLMNDLCRVPSSPMSNSHKPTCWRTRFTTFATPLRGSWPYRIASQSCQPHELTPCCDHHRNRDAGVIVCGDFNSQKSSPVYRYLRDGSIAGHKMKHTLALESAYAPFGEPLTNFTPKFSGCLDYIWYESSDQANTISIGSFTSILVVGMAPSSVCYQCWHPCRLIRMCLPIKAACRASTCRRITCA